MSNILENYKLLLKEKIKKEIKYTANEIIDYLYNKNENNIFILKIYDIISALDIENNEYIYELLNNLEKLNNASTYEMCPNINQSIYEEIEKRNKNTHNEYEYYNNDFQCWKCKGNRTTILFVNKHIGSDEASSLKITCVNCHHEWYS